MLRMAGRRMTMTFSKLRPLPEPQPGEVPVYVSLTSYGKRIEYVHLAIRSLMMQTMRPNKVFLWLGKDADDIALTRELEELTHYGLVIRRGVENIKGHKKYYFAMQELDDCLLITADDDLVYPKDVVESLLAAHAKYPNAVAARRTHRIVVSDGSIKTYTQWDQEWSELDPRPRKSLVATTGAGTLYPSSLFSNLVSDMQLLSETALDADDLWLKGIEAQKGIGVVYAPNKIPMPYMIQRLQKDSLYSNNKLQGGNDTHFQNIIQALELEVSDFIDDE